MKTIIEWKTEVKKYNQELKKKLEEKEKENQEIKNLYYGFEVIDGKLIENPKILFIGINPGSGDKSTERCKFETERISYLDIFNENYRDDYPNTYHLAEKTIYFFRAIGWNDQKIKFFFSNNVTKTNFYHIATDNIKKLERLLKISGIKDKYFKKSAEFTMTLIKILKPQIVILEGKKVFDSIVEECYEIPNAWTNDKFGYIFDKKIKTHIIGYSRGRDYTNTNKAAFVSKLKQLLS